MHAARPSAALGVLGGTFNPPHLGHLALARAAADQLALERVLLTPARAAPHKPDGEDPGVEHRLRMCQLLAGEDPRIELCALELDRPAPSYTVDTLQAIHEDRPGAHLTLIVGADMARTLPSWREPRRILTLARLAVAGREGERRDSVLEALAPLDGAARTTFLDMMPVEVSSSMVRAHAAAGEPIDGLVGRALADYIAEHGLYRARASSRPEGSGDEQVEGCERMDQRMGGEHDLG